MRHVLIFLALAAMAGVIFFLGSGTADEIRQARFHIRGKVMDMDREPVEGCRALLFLSKPTEDDLRDTLMLASEVEGHLVYEDEDDMTLEPPAIGYGVTDENGVFELRLSTRYGMRGPVFFGCSFLPEGHPFDMAWVVYVAPGHPILVHEVDSANWPFAGANWERDPAEVPDAVLPEPEE